jgi:hypothetical protein
LGVKSSVFCTALQSAQPGPALTECIASLRQHIAIMEQLLTLHDEGWRKAVAFQDMVTETIGFGDVGVVTEIEVALSFVVWIVDATLLCFFKELVDE